MVARVPVVTLGLFILVVLSVRKHVASERLQIGAFAASVTLSGTMLIILLFSTLTAPASTVLQPAVPLHGEILASPDILFVVMDSYAREDVLREIYDYDNSPFVKELEAAGFIVPSRASANYSGTHVSLPSVLNLEYLVDPEMRINNSDLEVLAEITAGDNVTVQSLKSHGYVYVHGDSTSWINRCGPHVDICLPGPLIRTNTYRLLADTPAAALMYPRSGEPDTNLNLRRMSQLRDWGSLSSGMGSAPKFVFMHLELPHPPLYLTHDCGVRLDERLGGPTMTWQVETPAHLTFRKDAYVAQVRCANDVIIDFVSELTGDEIVIITADHGPDSEGTLGGDSSTWTHRQIWERLSTFTALRLPRDCNERVQDDFELVNTMRVVLSCIYGSDLPLKEPSYTAVSYSGPVIPLKDPDS